MLHAGGNWRGDGYRRGLRHHFLRTGPCGEIAAGLQLCMLGIAVNHHPLKVKVNGDAVVKPLPDHRLPLDVDVLPVLDGQSLDVFAVQVQRHGLGLHAQTDLVPVAVEQVVDFGVLEHSSDGVFGESDRVVLHGLVLTVQADGHLWDSIFVKNLPEVPVLSSRGFPELERRHKGIFIRKPLREHFLRLLYDGHGAEADVRTLTVIVSGPQNLSHVEVFHQVKAWNLSQTITGAVGLEAIGLDLHVWTQDILAQPPPQPAPDLVDGIKVRHVEDVGVLRFGSDLLQLHL